MSTDRSATATYRGTGITTGGWASQQEDAEGRNARPDVNDMTAGNDAEICLQDETGQNEGLGSHRGEKLPNFHPQHVVTPVVKRGIPANAQTNPLGRQGRGK